MAVRLLSEGNKIIGVETIPSPKPKPGMASSDGAAGSKAVLQNLASRGGGFQKDSSGVLQQHFAREEVILSAGPTLR